MKTTYRVQPIEIQADTDAELIEKQDEEINRLATELYEAKSKFQDYRDAKWDEINKMKIEWGQEREMLAVAIHKLNIKVAERDCRIEELLDIHNTKLAT